MSKCMKQYEIVKNIKESEVLRNSYNSLCQEVFEFNFSDWYERGYWGEKYTPYAIVVDNQVVANVAVNHFDFNINHEIKKYIQIGTVMTHPDYRNQGLSKYLMEAVLADWQDKVDAIYLYGNGSVQEFYPKFGFIPFQEYQYKLDIDLDIQSARKLDIDNQVDLELLEKKYHEGNPFSKFELLDNFSMIMFYGSQILNTNIYYLADEDLVIFYDETDQMVYDIYGKTSKNIETILSKVVTNTSITLGFDLDIRKTKSKITQHLLENEDTYPFILKTNENIFKNCKICSPALSQA